MPDELFKLSTAIEPTDADAQTLTLAHAEALGYSVAQAQALAVAIGILRVKGRARSPRLRGFTLVEMLTVVAVIGLILSLVGLEFINVVSDTMHTRADTDAESQARLAMSKITTQMRTGYWDYIDYPNPTPTAFPVVSPQPGTTTLPYVAFYRAVPGSLSATMSTIGAGGPPDTPFELVTFQMSTPNPGELDEVITPQPNGAPSSPMPIALNVKDFEVTADPATFGKYDVKITISEPSNHCTSNHCTFTLDSAVYAGGTQ